MNIYEKINKIMGEVKSLQKDGKIAFGSTKYNYLSEAKTTEVFREKLIENKLVLLPVHAQETKDGQVTHGVYTYKLVNVENPEEQIDLMSCGQGHDTADKGSGKASSYAYKYLLWRTFAVPSNDDPDQISSDEISATASEETRRSADQKRTETREFEEAQKILFDTALKYGFMPQQVQDKYFEVKGKQLFLAESAELLKMADWYNKEYGKKQTKSGV
jgi:hypothetical protein